MIKNTIILFLIVSSWSLFAQKYQFETIKDIEASTVKSQGQTGTCWSFATTSFIESEIIRLTGKHIDIAEMFIVRNTYDTKAWNYVMRQGYTRLSEGGLAHDVINAIATGGLVPQANYTDIYGNNKVYNHKDVVPNLKKVLDAYIKNDTDSKYPNWKKKINAILDKNIGVKPTAFLYENQTYTPASFASYVKIIPADYITLTSFTHQKNYAKFVLNIPDNFSNGHFYNLPLDEFVSTVINALENGYTIALDADVSEKTFSVKTGVAVIPKDMEDNNKSKTEIVPEKEIDAIYRQTEFENYNTTDDHLMHITGLVKDQKGNLYFKVKNSWGGNSSRIGNNGYIYMSVPYFRLKTISVLLHKKALSKELTTKLKL